MNAKVSGRTMAVILALWAPKAWSGGFKAAAVELAAAARREGLSRVAVMPFVAADASPAGDGATLSERFLTQFVRTGKVKTVERALLKKLMEEHSLGRSGLLDQSGLRKLGRVYSVDAVVSGSFVSAGSRLTADVRLINLETGAIVAAAEGSLERDWEGSSLDPEPVPVEVPSAAAFPALALAAAEADEPGCSAAAERVDKLQRAILDVKARYWAELLHKGVSFTDMRREPGSMISNQDLRWDLYDRIRTYYVAREVPALSGAEISYLALVDRLSGRLHERCAAETPSRQVVAAVFDSRTIASRR